MRILVVVVTFNAMKWIERCIDSVRNSSIDNEIIIIDNISTDGTVEYLENKYPEIKVIRNNYNMGFGKANNIGMSYGLKQNFDYIYLLNQDAWVEHDTFEKLINAHKTNCQFGILSPMQLQANMNHFDVNFRNNIGKTIGGEDLLENLFFQTSINVFEVDFVMASHWLISRDCLEKVGGFSPSFPHYGEDDNYINRARFHGFKVGIVRDAIAIHDRENRVISNEKRFYIKWYIGTIIKLSSLKTDYGHFILKYTIKAIKEIIRFNIYPLKYSQLLLIHYFSIINNKKRSKKEGAFLN